MFLIENLILRKTWQKLPHFNVQWVTRYSCHLCLCNGNHPANYKCCTTYNMSLYIQNNDKTHQLFYNMETFSNENDPYTRQEIHQSPSHHRQYFPDKQFLFGHNHFTVHKIFSLVIFISKKSSNVFVFS